MYGGCLPGSQGGLLSLARGVGRVPKDSGQRGACGCAPAKDIGRYDTCPHLCAYCYANSSGASVLRSVAAADSMSERL